MSDSRTSITRLIQIPVLITLAITLLRLLGEMQQWSPLLFSREPGGPGALVGIVWLVPIFGLYFGIKLAQAGDRPSGLGSTILWTFLGIVAFVAIGFSSQLFKLGNRGQLAFMAVAAVVAIALQFRTWPELTRTLLVYGLAARIPVIIIMLLAFRGNWGTHYDAVPPDLPAMAPMEKFFWLGLIPQLTLWIAFTVLFGRFFGAIGAVLARQRKSAMA
ncbi:MAG: hypothetical protein ACR2L2_14235 [Acidobacteriota bacterium]